MADALVSIVMDRLISPITGEIEQEVKLLLGAQKEVEKLTRTFKTIRAALDDAEKREAKEEAVQTWLDELKEASYDMDDALDEWSTARLKSKMGLKNSPWPKVQVCWSLSPCLFQVFLGHGLAHKIKDINERLDEIENQKNRYNFKFTTEVTTTEISRPKTTSFIDVLEVHTRDQVKKCLVSRLLETSEAKQHPPVISVVGMGGIRKTTLTQFAYHDPEIKNHFRYRVWVCVSDPFILTNIARAIIEGIDCGVPNVLEAESWLQQMSKTIKNKKLLLVLDDVWTEKYEDWTPLRNSLNEVAQGSKILVTTRSIHVATMMGSTPPIRLDVLSSEECWLVFSHIAFFERTEEERKDLESSGRKIAEKCKGLPLPAKVLGGLMRFKKHKQEWQNVLDSHLWDLDVAKAGIFSPMWLSYYNLPSAIKRCLLYCVVFPKDYDIDVEALINLWMANGFVSTKPGKEMEVIGREYFDNLAMHSFFQEFRKDHYGRVYGCKMHDMVHDFVQLISKHECRAVEVYNDIKKMSEYLSGGKLRHSSFLHEGDESLLSALNFNIKGLHTMLLGPQRDSLPIKKTVLTRIFSKLTRLRVLALSYVKLKELPKELGYLIHLRYLKVENTRSLKALPETVCNLINMQTLELRECWALEKLPRGIHKLINLRHLQIHGSNQIRGLPNGVVQLNFLQTLSLFVVVPNKEDDKGGKYWCKLGDLEKLNLLQGKLIVSMLGNVEDAAEAKKAALKNKERLQHLELDFNASVAPAKAMADVGGRDLAVIEALEPPPQLVSLQIRNYSGTKLPSWVTSLSKLRILDLISCHNLKDLPCNFPKLQLEKMTVEFCPYLQQRLGPNGVDAPLVSHIPTFGISIKQDLSNDCQSEDSIQVEDD